MKTSPKEYSKIIVQAAERDTDVKQIARELWFSLYRDKHLTRLNQIFDQAEDLVREKSGQVLAQVKTATELTDSQIEDIEIELKQLFHKEIILDISIDQSLGAGIIIKAGDKLIDASSLGKIERLKKKLKEQK